MSGLIGVLESFPKIWRVLRPYLKRPDSYLLVVSLVLFYVVALFQRQYGYWASVVVVLCVIATLAVGVAIACSLLRPSAGAWKPYGIGFVVSIALLIWLGASMVFYLYSLLLLVAIFVVVWKGGSHASSN